MKNNLNLISKYLKKRNWVYDDTQYIFRVIEPKDSYFQFIIDCVLPKKGQSYTSSKFEWCLFQIMKETNDMFDEKIAFQAKYFVDGEVAENVYLNEKTKLEIREGLKKVNWFELKDKPPINTKFSCEVKVYPSSKPPYADNESVDFPFFWDVFNITVDDTPVEVNSDFYKEAKGYIDTLMVDNDFSSDITDIIYSICEKDFGFINTDMYIIANGWLRKIDGVDDGYGIWDGRLKPDQLFSAKP